MKKRDCDDHVTGHGGGSPPYHYQQVEIFGCLLIYGKVPSKYSVISFY